MRYAALSDLHLGFRGIGRTVGGRNQREIDVEQAWLRAVRQIVERGVEVVFIGGDCFHSVRPSFHAVKAFQQGLEHLHHEEIQVFIVNGNHESPRTTETLSPNVVASYTATIFQTPGTYSAFLPGPGKGEDGEVPFMLSVTGLPFVALAGESVYKVEPDPDADVNVLLIHAAVRASARPGALPTMYGGPAAYDVSRAEGFDLVVCGDFHEFTVLGTDPFAFYPGSIERTSSDIWKEQAPKGFVVGDTAAGTFEFVEIPTRPMFDLELQDFCEDDPEPLPYNAESVNLALRRIGVVSRFQDALVRLKVEGFPPAEKDSIDWKLVAALKERCCHFLLDLRMAESAGVEFGDRRQRQGRTLADEAHDFLVEDEPAVRDAALTFLGVE